MTTPTELKTSSVSQHKAPDLLQDGCGATIELIDIMGDDQAIVDMARVCITGLKVTTSSQNLIRYLMRHYHTTPFEGVVTKWRVKCPVFVARQWFRHRTWSYNEMSQRYAEVPDEMHVPHQYRSQAQGNLQGSDGPMLKMFQEKCKRLSGQCNENAHMQYSLMLQDGIAREQARHVLPMGVYTQFIGVVNLWNLMAFLRLRMDDHAQEEIRVFAVEMYHQIGLRVPIAIGAFSDYILNSVTFSSQEQMLLRQLGDGYQILGTCEDASMTKREAREFIIKVKAVFGGNASDIRFENMK